MPFEVTITPVAAAQLRAMPARDQGAIRSAIKKRLRDQPTSLSKAVKRLRPNPMAEYELPAGDLRVLYDVEGLAALIVVVGRKIGNKLFVEGEEFHDHEDDSTDPPMSTDAVNVTGWANVMYVPSTPVPPAPLKPSPVVPAPRTAPLERSCA